MRRRWIVLALGALGALPSATLAQSPFNVEPPLPGDGPVNVGGLATVDLVTLRTNRMGAPLRFGGIIAASETVELAGERLSRGVDYQIDYPNGVIFISRPIRDGQTVLVRYRYDAAKQPKPGQNMMGLGAFRLDLMPGAFSMVFGVGMTERLQDGNVLSSNIFGWNNKFDLGSGALKGLYLVGQRERAAARSNFEFSQPGAASDLGTSTLTVQDLDASVGGGRVTASYQDVSKNFSSFGAAADAGFEASRVAQLQKEKGLKRFSLDAENLKAGDLKFGANFKTVGEGRNSIDWRGYSLGIGGFEASWSSQRVEQGFTRFKDIAEKDREQLAKEVGMSREALRMGFTDKQFKVGFDSNAVFDPEKNSVSRSSFALETGGFSLKSGSQAVDRQFTRIASLPEPERNRLAREVGTSRDWLELSFRSPFGGDKAWKLSQSRLSAESGEFESRDLALSGKGWNLEHISRGSESGFGAMGAMQDDERAANVAAIARMYQPDGITPKPDDIGRFLNGPGIDRSVTRLSLAPASGWTARAETMNLGTPNGDARVDTLALASGGFTLNFRSQTMDDEFGMLGSLMEFERQRLGTIAGLDRMDLSANLKIGRAGNLSFSQLTAEAPDGEASRRTLAFKDSRLDLRVNQRSVDSGFGSVNQLLDPEQNLLATLRGFNQIDVKATWQLAPTLKLDAFLFDANNPSIDERRSIGDYRLNWTPTGRTSIGLLHLRTRDDDPLRILLANATDLLTFAHDFGRFGKLQYLHETRDYEGENAALPDSDKHFASFETKIDSKTSFRTEQTKTRFDNGDKEDVSAHSISTSLTNRLGVSVSQVSVDRDGEDRDENKRDVGFWIDFGRGIRFSYGMNRHEKSPTSSTQTTQATITPGTVGNVTIGQASYNENRQDLNAKSAGNIALSMARPSRLGFLQIDELKASLLTNRDRGTWLKEDQNFRIAGKFGANGFSFDYKSQMHNSGIRGVDRDFFFTTDQKETSPFRASFKYKIRTLPTQDPIMIRNFSLTAKPSKNFEISHQLLTNPEVARGDALLGSITQASQMSRWKMDYRQGPNLTLGAQWEEIMDTNRPRLRTAGVNVKLFEASGSPLLLFYGLEQADRSGGRFTTHRYSLRFDQRPGPNQVFSIFAGNVSYQHRIEDGKKRENWTLQLNYQWRF